MRCERTMMEFLGRWRTGLIPIRTNTDLCGLVDARRAGRVAARQEKRRPARSPLEARGKISAGWYQAGLEVRGRHGFGPFASKAWTESFFTDGVCGQS